MLKATWEEYIIKNATRELADQLEAAPNEEPEDLPGWGGS